MRYQTRKKYRRGKTVVLTSALYKLEEREKLKRTKKCSSSIDHGLKKSPKKQKTRKARSEGENVKEDALCIYCLDSNHTYLKSSERWVACQLCGQWAHTACAGVDDADLEEIHIYHPHHTRYPILPLPRGTMEFSLMFFEIKIKNIILFLTSPNSVPNDSLISNQRVVIRFH